MTRAFIDLHCHSKGSFDCLSDPRDIVKAASDRGLTHVVITDHDRIDVALEAREIAPAGLTVIVGEEVKTTDGDLICVFLDRAIPPGLSAVETIAAAREQGGLVGIPHPFDRMRGSLLRDAAMASLAPLVDWVETHNARVVGPRQRGRAGVRARARSSRRGGLRRAFDHGGRRRLHRPRWRSVDRRLGCSPRSRAPRSSRAARPSSCASGRRSPRASTASVGTAASSPSTPPRLRTGRDERPDGPDRHRRRRSAGPSSGGRPGGRFGRVWCDGVDTRAERADHAPRARIADRSPRG